VKGSVGLIPNKDAKKIASIATIGSGNSMATFLGSVDQKVLSTAVPAAKDKGAEIYKALKAKKASPEDIGKAAVVLWMQGKTQIALCMMAEVCTGKTTDGEILSNYASMLHAMGAPELAIPILNDLNARYKRNSTILNNLGQAWFALGDMGKSEKYLDSTLRLSAGHTQANSTMSVIAESKGDKTAAIAYAKASFRGGYSAGKADRLRKLGYSIGPDDYSYPAARKSEDLLNLSGFSMPAFPLSVAEMIALEPIWKQFRSDIDQRMKPLKKITDESNKATTQRLEAQMKQFVDAKNKTLSDPGSVSQASAIQIVGAPLFSERMNAKEKIVMENLGKKKQAVLQRIAGFINGEGAAMKKKFEETNKKIDEDMRQAEKNSVSQTVDPSVFCPQRAKAASELLKGYNTKLEGLYNEYLGVEKQILNEMAYSARYTTYPEVVPGVIAGLQMQWLRDLSLTFNGFNYLSVTKYDCSDPADVKGGRLTAFRDPNCDINSEFGQKLGLLNLGFSIKLDCSGMTTKFDALFVGVQMRQDLDHASFGDSYQGCTISVGPRSGVSANLGPVEVGAKAGMGVDVEMDRNGITDVVLTGGAEAEATIGDPVSVSAGVEGGISLISGAGSINGTGMFRSSN
jgi:hypothetical protein